MIMSLGSSFVFIIFEKNSCFIILGFTIFGFIVMTCPTTTVSVVRALCYSRQMLKSSDAGAAVDVTVLLRAWSAGDADALEQLAPLIYSELKQIARHCMLRERKDHTLQSTALVNEAFLRLFKAHRLEFNDRAHFFALSARIMRRILISHAVARQSVKRAGVSNTIPLDGALISLPTSNLAILELNRALEALARLDARKAQIVELHFFGGLSLDETAAVLNLSVRTIQRDWIFVKTWLAREMRPREMRPTEMRPTEMRPTEMRQETGDEGQLNARSWE